MTDNDRTRTTTPAPAEASDPRERATVPESLGDDHEAPTVLGHFAIGRRIGGGGMGVVFEARDTVLDRTVALKLVRPDARAARRGGDKARARLLREAQALARLKHPNVVTVFEVGTAGDEIFIAMELVEGDTLREWMKTPRDWRAVVDMFLAVGRGLAAAHALGLVHRDVKPSNVFLDRDGAPKVGDFGLVSSAGALDDDSSLDASPVSALGSDDSAPRTPHDRSLTTTGSVMGTPAYMAPEQVHGRRADARADQYAFCASLYEALSGRLPGDRDAPDARPIPPRLRSILARGLVPHASERYPSMDALCADLSRTRRGRGRVWIAGGGAAAALVIAAGAWTLARSRTDDPCPEPSAQLDTVWGEGRHAIVRDHVLAIDRAQGTARIAATTARVDPYLRGWRTMYVDACRATRVRGAQSDTLLDLRMRCLDRRLAELDDSLALVAGATTVPALDRALSGLTQVTPLDGCADDAALAASAPPPERPGARFTADMIARQIEMLTTRQRAGALDGLLANAKHVVDQARALDHAPTLSDALTALAQVQFAIQDDAGAATTLRELTQVAARAHDDRDEAYAWTKLIPVVGHDNGKPDQALALAPAASAAVLRAGDPVDLRSDLLYAEGQVLDEGPRAGDGLAKLEEARALLEKAGAAAPGSDLAPELANVVHESAYAMSRTGDDDGAVGAYRRAIALWQQLYGPDNPDEAFGWHNLGEEYRRTGQLDDALAAFRTAARIREARLGETPALAGTLLSIAAVLEAEGHWSDALATYDRALRIDRAQLGAADPALVGILLGRAMALGGLDRFDEAMQGYADAIALLQHAGVRTINLAITYLNRGELLRERGRCSDALADYATAISLFEELRGKNDSALAYPLVGEARCLMHAGRVADALAPLQRARALDTGGGAASERAVVRIYLGRALVETGRDRAGGLAMARAARDELAATKGGAGSKEVAETDRWLTAQR